MSEYIVWLQPLHCRSVGETCTPDNCLIHSADTSLPITDVWGERVFYFFKKLYDELYACTRVKSSGMVNYHSCKQLGGSLRDISAVR